MAATVVVVQELVHRQVAMALQLVAHLELNCRRRPLLRWMCTRCLAGLAARLACPVA